MSFTPPSVARPITPAIVTSEIGDAQVTPAKLSFTPVTRPLVPPVATDEIADASVTPAKLSFSVPVRPMVPPLATDEIGAGAVGSSQLAVDSVTNEKIAANAITAGKIASGAVGPSEIQSGAVSTDEIANGAVTAEKLDPALSLGDTLTMFPTPQTVLDQGGITATTIPATVDLSGIIPVNTKGVIVSIACINQSYANGGMMAYIFRQLGAEYALQVMAPAVNAPGISNGGSVLMPVATDRTLLWQAYVSGNNSTELVIYILGYIL